MSILSGLLLNSLHFPQKMLLFLSESIHLHFDYCTKSSFFFVGSLCAASERNIMKKFIIYLLKPFSFLPALLVMYMIFSFSSQTGVDSEISVIRSVTVLSLWQTGHWKKIFQKETKNIMRERSNFRCESWLI